MRLSIRWVGGMPTVVPPCSMKVLTMRSAMVDLPASLRSTPSISARFWSGSASTKSNGETPASMKHLAIKAVKLDFPVPPRPTVTKVFKTNNLKLFAVFLIKNSHILSMVLIGFFLLFYILRDQFLMKKRLINKQ